MMTEKEIQMYDLIVELGIATPEELNLVKNAKGGTWEDIMNLVVSIRTEYNTLDQYIGYEMSEE